MAAPVPRQTVIDQARDFYLTVIWQDSNKVPVNLAGYSASFSIRQDYGEPIMVSTSTQSGGITILAMSGSITVHLDQTQTSIDEGTYVCELIATSNSGIETSLIKGQIPVKAKVVA